MKEMHDAPMITISIHLPPPSGNTGKKKGEEAKARKAMARKKLKETPEEDEENQKKGK
tara:strand:- start:498 stop:671 length:174 start_codon:yes stop_codon:yes gene_type:complete